MGRSTHGRLHISRLFCRRRCFSAQTFWGLAICPKNDTLPTTFEPTPKHVIPVKGVPYERRKVNDACQPLAEPI